MLLNAACCLLPIVDISPIIHICTQRSLSLSFPCLPSFQLMGKTFSVLVQDNSQQLQSTVLLLPSLSFFMFRTLVRLPPPLFMPVFCLHYVSKKFWNENEWLAWHSGHFCFPLMASNLKLDSSQVLAIIKRVLYMKFECDQP